MFIRNRIPGESGIAFNQGCIPVCSIWFRQRFNSPLIPRRLLSNGTLYFSTVIHSRTNRPDEGIYQCVATLDGVGTIVSRTAELKVAGEKRVLFTGPPVIYLLSERIKMSVKLKG